MQLISKTRVFCFIFLRSSGENSSLVNGEFQKDPSGHTSQEADDDEGVAVEHSFFGQFVFEGALPHFAGSRV